MSYSDDRKEDSKRWSGNGSSGSSADKFSARLYVGRLSRSVTERDIDEAFGKYGRIREVDVSLINYAVHITTLVLEYMIMLINMTFIFINFYYFSDEEKTPQIGFCFVQFDDPRDADDAMRRNTGLRRVVFCFGAVREKKTARGVDGVNGVSPTQQTQVLTQYQFRALDGGRIQGNDDRILVEFARGSTWRGARESRHGSGRSYDGRPPERCFNCGQIAAIHRYYGFRISFKFSKFDISPEPPGSGERSRRYGSDEFLSVHKTLINCFEICILYHFPLDMKKIDVCEFTCGQPGHRARNCARYGSSGYRGRSYSPYRRSRSRSSRRSRSPRRSRSR
ncbi:2087_t:CDS:10 [Cetraspora pellucida]|uniref:2087_t:CDS:1 n=1 Tax=Cetraspora pellucida TaxID=1433469 RepID=A0A9N9EH14_9GLOM|nr:2087_t:CDS:10 [Cetraspora pellucida]